MAHKLPRAVRLDDSDREVYELAAEPGEWTVAGGFEFVDCTPDELEGKRLQAFKSGFLGLASFGRTTLVAITAVDETEYQAVIEQLAEHLLARYGAPDRSAAMNAAREEIAYAEDLCEYEIDTLLAVEREFTEDGISERFKKFIPSAVDWADSRPLVYRPVE